MGLRSTAYPRVNIKNNSHEGCSRLGHSANKHDCRVFIVNCAIANHNLVMIHTLLIPLIGFSCNLANFYKNIFTKIQYVSNH